MTTIYEYLQVCRYILIVLNLCLATRDKRGHARVTRSYHHAKITVLLSSSLTVCLSHSSC